MTKKPRSSSPDLKQVTDEKRAVRTWCTRCGSQRLGTVADKYVLNVGFATPLIVHVEARGCEVCRRPVDPGAARRAAETAALRVVVFSGQANGATLRFLRRAIGLQSKALASLLKLGPGTMSRWENGVRKIDVNAWVIVACLALEFADGGDLPTSRILEAIGGGEAPLLEIVVHEPEAAPTANLHSTMVPRGNLRKAERSSLQGTLPITACASARGKACPRAHLRMKELPAGASRVGLRSVRLHSRQSPR